jgi:hypothetical protein
MLQPAGRVYYDAGFPGTVSSPMYNVVTQQDNIYETNWPAPEANVDIAQYIDQSVGGTTGTVVRNGYRTGINHDWLAPISDRMVHFVRRDLSKDTGPVGLDNRANVLQAGVSQQFAVMPSLEDIYRGFVQGGA